METLCQRLAATLLCAWACVCSAADKPPQERPRDAAEAVQEGNVQNWVEYYRRTREAAPPPARLPAPAEPASPSSPPPAPR